TVGRTHSDRSMLATRQCLSLHFPSTCEPLLRPRRERPRRRRAAECSQQFPSSGGDCHTPLPCEVRKTNNTTPPACRLYVQAAGGCCRRSLEAIARREKAIVNQPVERA